MSGESPLTEVGTAQLRALATACQKQVHPANWSHWVRLVMMAGPARDFIEMASPTLVLALLAAVPTAPDAASELGRLLAERDRLIAAGADPAELEVPEQP